MSDYRKRMIEETEAHGHLGASVIAERARNVSFCVIDWHIIGQRFEQKEVYVVEIDDEELYWRHPEGFSDPNRAIDILARWLMTAEAFQ